MQINIRYAKLEDYEGVCRLFAEGDDFHRQALPHLFREASPARTEDFFKGYIGNARAHILVAESGMQLLGLIEFHVVVKPEHLIMFPRTYVFVDSLTVQQQARRHGVGQALMAAVHEWARDHDLAEIELNVHEFNQSAIAFYTKLGYATISRRMMKRI
jgi:ribosomal protein S18 acetylase RimI-like enzyme